MHGYLDFWMSALRPQSRAACGTWQAALLGGHIRVELVNKAADDKTKISHSPITLRAMTVRKQYLFSERKDKCKLIICMNYVACWKTKLLQNNSNPRRSVTNTDKLIYSA